MAETNSLILLKQENLELNKENQALKTTVTKLLEEIDRLRELSRPTDPNIERIIQSPEQKIIEEQINSFETISRQRGLTLEEIRGLDLLIKNKKLLEGNKPLEPDWSKVPEGQTDSDLLRIAGNVEESTIVEKPKRSKSKASTKNTVA